MTATNTSNQPAPQRWSQSPSQLRPQLKVLSKKQCEEIYQATLACLERVGVLVNYQEARTLLAAAGARVIEDRVYIPAQIIEEAIAATPRSFSLWGREEGREIHIPADQPYYGPGPTCSYFIDPETGERRRARRGDAGLTALVCDALENIDYVMSLSHLDDVSPVLSPVYEFAEMVTMSGKPIVAWANNRVTLSDITQIAAAVSGGEDALRQRPIFAFFAAYESPLHHLHEPLVNMFWAADHDIPIVYIGGPTIGIESPMTGASALVIHMAAVLSGLAMIQLKRKGTPMVISGIPAAMDLRTARPAYGSPELVLHLAAATDLARYLGLPYMGTAGSSESKLLDSQAAIEISLQILAASLSGASLVHDVGMLDCVDIGSLPLLVMADEVIAMVKRIMRGVQVDQETIMLDLIEKVGPGGSFLGEYQSASLCRSEIWTPKLGDRDPYVIWEGKGGRSMEERVKDKLDQILVSHLPLPLAPDVQAAIKDILEKAENREAGINR
jgi:trimethylamine--corrinoid protein Co-methyltransferase